MGNWENLTCILPIVNCVGRNRTCKLPHCAIDPDVAFWHDYLSPAWMHRRQRRFSLGDTRHEMSLDTGPLEKIVEEGKGIFTKRFILQLKHISRHDCIWQIISSLDICETIRRNWLYVFFLLPRKHTIHPLFFQNLIIVEITPLLCRITTIIITLNGPRVPVNIQLADKNKMSYNSIQTQYLLSAPHTHKYGTWLCRNQVQDCSPHTPGGSKNALSPVGIPLKRDTSGARQIT